jgi:hypothetical protein
MTRNFDIDYLVREVLAELNDYARGREGEAPAEPLETPSLPTAPPARQEPRPPGIQTSGNSNAELILCSRLVTMNEVAGRLAGVRRLVVQPGTIITPAVKDEIRNRNIQVKVAAATTEAKAGPLRLVIIAARSKIDPQPLAAALGCEQIEVELHSSKCVIEATDQLAGEVKKNGTLGLLITPHEAESLCLANRLSGVRAIAGRDAGQVATDATAVGANVLVISPKTIGPYAIRQMLGEFCRSGVRPCPEALKERLT